MSRTGQPFVGHLVSWGSRGCRSVLTVEGNHARAFAGVEDPSLKSLGLGHSHSVDWARIVELKAAAAISAARRICYPEIAGTTAATAATADVVEGGAAEEGVASIGRVVSGVWSGFVRVASVALEGALVLGSMERETRMRLKCRVLSGAIRLAAGVLEGVLAAAAHCIAAVVAAIARVALLQRRLLARLGSRTM